MPVAVTDWKGCLYLFYLSPMTFGYAPPFFFFWLFSPSALFSSHFPFKRRNASTDRSVIMMFPFSMLDSSTSKTATTCENRYLHMWWGGRDEKDVGKKAMGSWYWRMDLCTYYLDTIYIYIHTYRQSVCNDLNLENVVTLIPFFRRPHYFFEFLLFICPYCRKFDFYFLR